MIYYDLEKNWRRVCQHVRKARPRLVRDFNKYTMGRWGARFPEDAVPADFESCDWSFMRTMNGEKYRPFWRYVKHGACHWVVNFALELAMFVEPTCEWRILTSGHIVGLDPNHSTVWDGVKTLFDFNYQALGISADECFRNSNVRHLKPGCFLRVYYPQF